MYIFWNVECLCRAKCSKRQLSAHKLKVNGFYKRNACVSSKASVNSLSSLYHFISLSLSLLLQLAMPLSCLSLSRWFSCQWVHDTDSAPSYIYIPVWYSSVFVALSGDVFVVSFDFRWYSLLPCLICEPKTFARFSNAFHEHGSSIQQIHRDPNSTTFLYYDWRHFFFLFNHKIYTLWL